MADAALILGLESSCDDTAAALVRVPMPGGRPAGPGDILASVVMDQTALHAAYGGVVPEIAARAHAERLDLAVEQALAEAGATLGEVDAVAATAGPGLIGGVMTAAMTGKALAWALGRPFVAVNHLAGHALTPRLTEGTAFPYLMLLVSGGHCQFLAALGPTRFRRLGGTIDDAPGEAFDKAAKLLGLPQPGGPAVAAEAESGDPARFALPRPLLDRPGLDMSFSGLKTALRRARDLRVAAEGGLTRQDRADLCAGFEAAAVDVLSEKARRALVAFAAAHGRPSAFAVAGGVAANRRLRAALEGVAAEAGVPLGAPPLALCTDNAAMIAWAGAEKLAEAGADDLSAPARPRWPLDAEAAPLLGAGRKGAKG